MIDIRKYKFAYQLYNFFKRPQLKHNLSLYKQYGLQKKYYSSISSEDLTHLKSPLNIHDSQDSAIAMPRHPEFEHLSDDIKAAMIPWSTKGYVVLEKFYTDSEVEACNREIQQLLDNKTLTFKYRNKLMFAFRHSALIRDMGTNKRLMKILSIIMGKEVELFQSINFLKGSQQRTHSDSIHMTTFPYGNLIAVWIALEDIQAEAGPLHYYPGSHKLPYIMNRYYGNVGTRWKLGSKTYSDYEDYVEKIIAEKKLVKKEFHARKGDVLIWHANLLHGGEKVVDKHSTRKSMVFHYYSNDAICFHEITQRPALRRSLD